MGDGSGRLQAYSPLALQARRAIGAVVGRPLELAAIRQEMEVAGGGRLAAVTVEGEPGIGKTRLLLATGELASAGGFTAVTVAADEELRGPFLLARSIVGSPEAVEPAFRPTRSCCGPSTSARWRSGPWPSNARLPC